jgi:hypothetical protein
MMRVKTPLDQHAGTPGQRLAIGLAICAVGSLALTFVLGSTPDEEEFRFAILSSWLRIDGLIHGHYDLWTGLLGLGLPLSLTPSFELHPLLPALALLEPANWARLLVIGHLLWGAAGIWMLTRAAGVSAVPRAVCVITFLFATPVQNYVMTDFWPSHLVAWTTMPWILLMTWRVMDAADPDVWFWAVALGLTTGLLLANTNPGHVVVYGTLGAATIAAHARRVAARWRWFGIAALIATAIAAPMLLQLRHEIVLFDPNLSLANVLDPLPASAFWTALFSPWPAPASMPIDEHLPFTRTLFFGGPFVVLCGVGCFIFARQRMELVLTIVVCSILLFSSTLSLSFVSARFHFRDPLTLAAIVLAGMTLDRLFGRGGWRAPAAIIAVVQAAVLIASAWPAWSAMWQVDARRAIWFRGATGRGEAAGALTRLLPERGRLVYSPQVDHEVYERGRLPEGLGVNALAYRGIAVVNGWFKGVSTGTIWPEQRLPYGRIIVPSDVVASHLALDLLNIDAVLANGDEPVAAGLEPLGPIAKRDGSHFLLYRNREAWGDAFIAAPEAERLKAATRPGCGNATLLCADLQPLAARRLPEQIVVRTRSGRIDVRVEDAAMPRLLGVAQMFRRDWIATSDGNRLVTVPVLGSLLGVRIPPGTRSIQLRYRPYAIIAATAAAWITIIVAAALLAARAARSRIPIRS